MYPPKILVESFRRPSAILATLGLSIALVVPAFGQDAPPPPVKLGAEQVEVVTPFVFEGNLRDLPLAPRWQPGDPIKEIPRRHFPRPGAAAPSAPANPPPVGDPLLAVQPTAPASLGDAFTAPDLNFDGQGYTGVNPPDTVGDVGVDYYIQMINASGGAVYEIYDKTTGALVAGPTFLDGLGSGFCANGLGDPIVLYDHLAGRWLLSEFSSAGNRLCVYVSQTGDPIAGGWFNYDFQAPGFPDYPKYAVWPDAYYVSTNEASPASYALERSAMLAGNPAAAQRFTAPDLSGFGFQATTPSDLDGPAPPAGAPHYFVRHNDDEVHDPGANDPGQDFIEIFELAVDFANPTSSTFTGPFQVGIADIDSSLCGLVSFSCIPQPGTSVRLDPLREVVMWRSQYRNFGSHEVLVGSLATDVDGADRSGVRWYELRKSGAGAWTLFQEGTYAIDSDSRWMSSIAMDSSGNIAVGYNVGSSATFPGLRYTGRLAGDAPGTMGAETVLIAGTASNASNRYGDYSSLNVDPVDDCTLWLTGEYNASSQWSTRIGRFVFAGCGGTCGNGVKEGGEACDGTDLGGETCGSQGCDPGGTLACLSDCSGFDTSGCTNCPVCDDDGTCESGEDCLSCPGDCVSGTSAGASCGNGVCEAGDGENCLTCAADCAGRTGGKPQNRFCCGFGDGLGPDGCGDSRCTTGGFLCVEAPQPPADYCCGDLICEGDESCSNCALDCTLGAEICSGGVDEDCDGSIDCSDADCSVHPDCQTCTLGQKNDPCSTGADCCSGVCKNNGRCR